MGEKLTELLFLAMHDKELKEKLIKTKSSKEPLEDFCNLAKDYGFNITIGELICDGEEFCSAMLRSVNGGGVDAFDSWTDFYELFFASLEA